MLLGAKVAVFIRLTAKYLLFFDDFNKKVLKSFGGSQKSSTFATAKTKWFVCTKELGYGVMVTLQILVLPFLVRVRVPQQNKIAER